MWQISLNYGRKEEMAYKQEMWDEAKKKCRIGDEKIEAACREALAVTVTANQSAVKKF